MRSVYKQKQDQVMYEHIVTHPDMLSVISQLNNSTKIKFNDNHASAKVINENKKRLVELTLENK